MKSVRIITSLKEKEDRQVCFQGSKNKNNIAIIDDILGYREEGLKELLSEKIRYIDEERARHLRDSRQLRVSSPDASVRRDEPSEKARLLRERRLQSGAAVQPNEPSSAASSIYSSPSQANYSKKLENMMDAADKKFENKKDKVVSSLRDMGVKVTEHKRRDNASQYIDVHLDNGSTIYVRVSDHPARTRIDVSIEKDWKAGTRFIYEQVKQNDWATAENPYWQGDAKLRFSRKEKTETEENKNGQDWLLDKNGNRVKDNRPVKPIVEESTKAVILDTAEKIPTRKDSILKYLKDYLVGKGLSINTPFGKFNVLFRYDGLKHDVWSQRISQKKAQTFTMLPELVQNARYFGEDSVKHDKNNLKTENLYHLISLVKNGNKYDIVRIVLKGTKKGKYVYNHSVYEGSSTEGAVLSRIKAIASQIHVELLNKDSQNISESQADTANFNFSRPEKQSAQEKREYQQKKAREEITSKSGRIIQATTDAFAPLAALERVIYGKIRGAEKSAWKMALMTKNLDQVMFHLLRVGAIKYNKADGSFTTREGTKGLEEILNPIKGKAYKNFENFAKAKSAFERWAFLRKKKPFEKLSFADLFGFTIEDAKKWIAEASDTSKQAFADLQVFFQSQRDFMLETELITPEQHAALSKFKNYVPFFREGKDLEKETEEAYERYSEIFPGGKGFSGRSAGIEKFIGSSRKTKNLVENIMNQARRTMDSGYKNIAAYRALNLMRKIDMAKYVRSDSVDARVKIAELRRALEAEGIDVGNISDDDLLRKVPVEAYLDLVNDKNDNIVSVRVGGTLRFYKVETLRSKEPSNTSAETSSLERASTISLARKF